MVASKAVLQDSPEIVVLEIAAQMQAHVAEGDWDRVEQLAVRIRNEIVRVPERRRRDAILAVAQQLEQVQSRAHDSWQEVADQLSAIRRGQDATKAYAGMD